MRYLIYLSVIVAVLSTVACTPTVLVPELEYVPHQELAAQYPDCGAQVQAVREAGEMVPAQTALNLVLCYRDRANICDDEYQVIDAQFKVLEREGASEE